MNYRNLRVAKLIEEELSGILIRETETEGALVTITGVEVLNDLSSARVKLGVIPGDKNKEVIKKIGKKTRFLRKLLLKKINIKPMPDLVFEIDKGAEAADDFEKALLRSKDENVTKAG